METDPNLHQIDGPFFQCDTKNRPGRVYPKKKQFNDLLYGKIDNNGNFTVTNPDYYNNVHKQKQVDKRRKARKRIKQQRKRNKS
jgi:hypothetical protein